MSPLRTLTPLAALVLCAGAAQAQDRWVVRADHVYTGTGETIAGGSVVVADGKIAGVGSGGGRGEELSVAAVTPGLIDLSVGIDTGEFSVEQSTEVSIEQSVADALDLFSYRWGRELRSGVTTVLASPRDMNVLGGKAVAIKTGGEPTLEARLLSDAAALRACIGTQPSNGNQAPRGSLPRTFFYRRPTTRMGVEWVFRKAFYDAINAQRFGLEVDELQAERNEVLGRTMRGELPLFVKASATQDVRTAIYLKEEFGIPTMIIGDAVEAWKEPEMVQRSGVALVLPPFPKDGRIADGFVNDSYFMTLDSAARFQEMGVTIALSGHGSRDVGTRLAHQPGFAMRGRALLRRRARRRHDQPRPHDRRRRSRGLHRGRQGCRPGPLERNTVRAELGGDRRLPRWEARPRSEAARLISPHMTSQSVIAMNRLLGRTLLTAAVPALLSLSTAASPLGADGVVIEAGRIITQAGEDIVDGVIVIEDGRITAIGPADQVEKPWDAPVIGGPDLVAFPGFVEAHTSNGMDRPNENIDVAPFLDVRDSVDPVAFYFEDCLRYGITTVNVQQGENCVIGGQGMIVRPTGMTIEEMMVRPRYGLKIATSPKRGKSRATQIQILRQTFEGLRMYLEELVERERDDRGHAKREALFQGRELDEEENEGREMGGTAWKVSGLELIPRGAIDEKQAPLLDLVEGRHAVFIQCESPTDVPHALEIARDNGFLARTTLVISASCWKAADLIAEAGVPVVLDGPMVHVRRDPVTGEETETFVPSILADEGIRFALSVEDPSSHSLWYQAALATGLGLDRQAALDAVTTVPAEILSMGAEVGALEVGRMGNVVLLSGDPLSVTTWVEHVVIEGKEVYDRSDDVRNIHLLEGVQPKGTAAEEGVSTEEEDEGDDE